MPHSKGRLFERYAVTRWLKESDERGIFNRYYQPPLINAERQTADLEGWILGIA